jgi:SAM-dependent methyltransferase
VEAVDTPKGDLTLQEVDREVKICADIVGRSLGAYLKTVGLVSEAFLAQILVALWDSGVYEYLRERGRIEIGAAGKDLNLDPEILRSLIEYLVGWGILAPEDQSFILTAKGRPYWNYITRGLLTFQLAGYNQLLVNLGPLLRKEIDINDPRLDRSGRLVASGSGYSLLGSNTIPWILKLIKQIGGSYVMDIGCGAGDFLTQLALRWPEGGGLGIDMNGDAIDKARVNAERAGVSDRLSFFHTKLSVEPMSIDKKYLERVDTLTAMYILHEFAGWGGPEAIRDAISQLVAQFPGRKLLMLEGERADPVAMCANPPRTLAQLDYSFIHPISRQGPLRTVAEWEQIIRSAGATLVERIPGFAQIPGWISLYMIDLG